jgi:uroporphyrinogen-III synthase
MVGALAGCTVGVTGDRRWQEQAEMLSRRGATVVHGPVMRTGLLHDASATLAATEAALAAPIDVIVLTTGIGTRSWFGVAESAGLDDGLRTLGAGATVVARGPKARTAAIGNGLEVHWQAPGETSAELVAHLRAEGVAGQRVVVQRDGGERPLLADALAALGADVVDVPVYRWDPPEDPGPAVRLLEAAAAGRVHALTFTCAYAVGSAFSLAPDPDGLVEALNGPVVPVAVGPVCAAALRSHGVEQVVEPGRARLGAMVQALVVAVSARHRVLRLGETVLRWQGDLLAHTDGAEALLTAGEARVLEELVRRAPAVVPKADLAGRGADDHAAEVAVARLRPKLGPLSAGIRSVPRRGYASTLEVTPAE